MTDDRVNDIPVIMTGDDTRVVALLRIMDDEFKQLLNEGYSVILGSGTLDAHVGTESFRFKTITVSIPPMLPALEQPILKPKVRRKLRLATCVAAWPECEDGKYNPNCCRFPKECSCQTYDPKNADRLDLEDIDGT